MQYLRVFRIPGRLAPSVILVTWPSRVIRKLLSVRRMDTEHPSSVETLPLGYSSRHIASDDILSQRESERHSKFPLYHSESLAVSHSASFVSIFVSSTFRDPLPLSS